jgi:hypothetical protein
MYVDSGGHNSNIYAFEIDSFSAPSAVPNTPAPTPVVNGGGSDWHGMTVAKRSPFLWIADRAANDITVINTVTDTEVNRFDLTSSFSADPSPDLLATSPKGNLIFASLRGPNPLSGDPHLSTGTTPGLGIIRVQQKGRSGVFQALAPISHFVEGVELADPHALGLRVLTQVFSRNGFNDNTVVSPTIQGKQEPMAILAIDQAIAGLHPDRTMESFPSNALLKKKKR